MNNINSSMENIQEREWQFEKVNGENKKPQPKEPLLNPKLKKALRFVITQVALVASVRI